MDTTSGGTVTFPQSVWPTTFLATCAARQGRHVEKPPSHGSATRGAGTASANVGSRSARQANHRHARALFLGSPSTEWQ